MDNIERWIRQMSARYVAAGQGQWADARETAFGKPIYLVSHGGVTLLLSQRGFSYDGPSLPFDCRYEEIESINAPTLRDYMLVSSDPEKLLTTELILRSAPICRDMQLPARMCWVVATVLSRIVSGSLD